MDLHARQQLFIFESRFADQVQLVVGQVLATGGASDAAVVRWVVAKEAAQGKYSTGKHNGADQRSAEDLPTAHAALPRVKAVNQLAEFAGAASFPVARVSVVGCVKIRHRAARSSI